MKVLGVIPARYASTRFPGKPLVMINGKSMIRRVYEQACKCESLSEVIVATDESSIENHVRLFGGNVMMTSGSHKSGTERSAEVAEKLRNVQKEFDVIVNIQGDEPYIDPAQIAQVVSCFGGKNTMIATLMKKITSEAELNSPSVVKVLAGTGGQALYFSRAVIPFLRDAEKNKWLERCDYFKHIGIYGYTTDTLMQIVRLPVSRFEAAESLEQLRWLDHGYSIVVKETEYESIAIDIPTDLLKLTNKE